MNKSKLNKLSVVKKIINNKKKTFLSHDCVIHLPLKSFDLELWANKSTSFVLWQYYYQKFEKQVNLSVYFFFNELLFKFPPRIKVNSGVKSRQYLYACSSDSICTLSIEDRERGGEDLNEIQLYPVAQTAMLLWAAHKLLVKGRTHFRKRI